MIVIKTTMIWREKCFFFLNFSNLVLQNKKNPVRRSRGVWTLSIRAVAFHGTLYGWKNKTPFQCKTLISRGIRLRSADEHQTNTTFPSLYFIFFQIQFFWQKFFSSFLWFSFKVLYYLSRCTGYSRDTIYTMNNEHNMKKPTNRTDRLKEYIHI